MSILASSTVAALGIALLVGVLPMAVSALPVSSRRTMDESIWWNRRLRRTGMGAVCGALVAAMAIAFSGADRGGSAMWVVFADATAGALLGMVSQRHRSRVREGEPTRVARSRHTPFADYSSSALRWAVRIVGTLALAAAIASIVSAVVIERFAGPDSFGMAVMFIVDPLICMPLIGTAAWAMFEVHGRRAATRAAIASSSDELDTDDCLRRQTISDFAWTALVLGSSGVLLSLPTRYLGQLFLAAPPSIDAFRLIVVGAGALAGCAVLLRPWLVRNGSATGAMLVERERP